MKMSNLEDNDVLERLKISLQTLIVHVVSISLLARQRFASLTQK